MDQFTTTAGISTITMPNSYYTSTSTSTDYLYQSISQWASTTGQVLKFQNGTVKITEAEEKKNLEITKVEILCSRKVLRFTFNDNTTIKTICSEEDTFDFRFAFFIAFAKKEYGKKYTSEGIFKKAEELSYLKEYNKKVDKAIKMYQKELKAKEEEEKKKEEQKLIKRNKLEKKRRRKEKARQARINEIAEAIKKSNQRDF